MEDNPSIIAAVAATFIIAAVAGTFSAVLYAFFYEPIVQAEEENEPLIPATILYGLASIILIIAFLISVFILHDEIVFPSFSTLHLWGTQFNIPISYLIFGGTMFLMAMGYYTHIVSEAHSRKHLDMGIYAIIFQSNVIVIIVLNLIINAGTFSLINAIGGGLVLFASIGAIISTHKNISFAGNNTKIIIWAIISALSCGFSLFIDGEISHHLFESKTILSVIPLFLLYELSTFAFPALFSFIHLCKKYQLRLTVSAIISSFSRKKQNYLGAAFFSVSQFVCSVFALSQSQTRFQVAVILGTIPVVSVILGWFVKREKRTFKQIGTEIIFSFITLIGIALILNRES